MMCSLWRLVGMTHGLHIGCRWGADICAWQQMGASLLALQLHGPSCWQKPPFWLCCTAGRCQKTALMQDSTDSRCTAPGFSSLGPMLLPLLSSPGDHYNTDWSLLPAFNNRLSPLIILQPSWEQRARCFASFIWEFILSVVGSRALGRLLQGCRARPQP